ncbi:MarR family transcriptional regulator [uncultured Bradyrhizobium sp.]|uniref:MarR family winged helix-turn-helix transcriptional regulator n=1 Tax=Bradyrhizobium sp. TaxID=376 RepID=UPI00260B8171|nr:MarR family transcriptional regulator [uncultured Bradyrhizobium sp.]
MKKQSSTNSTRSEVKVEMARMPLASRPGYLVRRLHQIHSAIFLEECQEFGITPVQYGLITTLLNNPGIDQVTLGGEVGIDRTNVADVLNRLSERGLVRRERSQTDRRSMVAFLTKEGEAVADKMYDSMRRAQDRFLAPLRPEFRAAFLAMVTELIEGNSKYSLPDTNSASGRRKSTASRDE